MAVSRPLVARRFNTKSRARATVVFIWISSIAVYIPKPYTIVSQHVQTNFEMGFHSPKDLCYNLLGFQVDSLLKVHHILHLILTYWLPLIITVFLNIRLVVDTRRAEAFRMQLQPPSRDGRAKNKSHRVTVTLVTIVIVFIVCQLPLAVIDSLEEAVSYHIYFVRATFLSSGKRFDVYIARYVGITLVVINSSADCVTYFLMGKRFREILVRTLLCRRQDTGKTSARTYYGKLMRSSKQPSKTISRQENRGQS
jgi:hypothetical protein